MKMGELGAKVHYPIDLPPVEADPKFQHEGEPAMGALICKSCLSNIWICSLLTTRSWGASMGSRCLPTITGFFAGSLNGGADSVEQRSPRSARWTWYGQSPLLHTA